MTGELDGQAYAFERHGRRHFSLVQAGAVVATADAGRGGRWAIRVGDSAYELRRKSPWRSEMELHDQRAVVGSIRKGRRGAVVCDLPHDLSPPAQAFVGFLLVTLRTRAAAGSGAGAAPVGG